MIVIITSGCLCYCLFVILNMLVNERVVAWFPRRVRGPVAQGAGGNIAIQQHDSIIVSYGISLLCYIILFHIILFVLCLSYVYIYIYIYMHYQIYYILPREVRVEGPGEGPGMYDVCVLPDPGRCPNMLCYTTICYICIYIYICVYIYIYIYICNMPEYVILYYNMFPDPGRCPKQ